MMLISVVLPAPFGPEQREDLALRDFQIDGVERHEARRVGLGETTPEAAVGLASSRFRLQPIAGPEYPPQNHEARRDEEGGEAEAAATPTSPLP